MSVDVHETYAELEATRRAIATARHMLEFAHPDAVPVWRERLEDAEAREQAALSQLERLDKPAKR
jgi:hypothetical protein